jgi:hypothetical protein
MERLAQFAMVPFAIGWAFASPVTYILAVVETWQSAYSVPVKLLLNFTLDPLTAAFWPFAWLFWGVMHYNGASTPLRLLFG